MDAPPTDPKAAGVDPASDVTIADQIRAMNAGNDEALGLVDRLIVDNGRQMVEFYQSKPGEILVSVAGLPSTNAVLTETQLRTLRPTEIYARLAPERAVPPLLVDASARLAPQAPEPAARTSGSATSTPADARSVSPQQATKAAPASDDQIAVTTGALTSGYCGTRWFTDFNGNGCGSTPADYQWCLTDWGGGAWAAMNNGWASYFNLCPEIGSATLTISGTAGNNSWFVPQNTYRWFHRAHYTYSCGFLGLGSCQDRYNERGDVTNASSTTFNYMGYFDWN